MKDIFDEWLKLLRGNSAETFRIGEAEIEKTKLVRIITGVALGFILYFVGLLAELINNFNKYTESGGLVGGVMPEMKFAPYIAFGNLFSKGGLTAIILIAVVAFAIFILIKYKEALFGTGEYDERGFKKTKDGLYGTADWMSEKEAKEVLEIGNINSVTGDVLGEKNGKLYCLPVDTRFNRHKMIIGASGTMKSRAQVRNAIFQAIKRGESVGITDPKAEMFADTYELFKKYDYDIKVLNLVSPDHGNQWNCMSDLNGDTLLAQMLTNIIIGNTTDGRGDQFWDNGERNLLKALILYVDNNEKIPKEKKSLATVYEILTSTSEKELMKMFEQLPASHPAKAPYNLFAQSTEQVKSGFILGLGTRLQVLQNEAVKNLVSGNDIDLTSLGRKKTAFFVILPDQDTTMKFISSLFFSLMFIKLTRYADEQPGRKCAVPVNLILDEFNNVGRIGGAEDGSDFARTLSVIRSRDVRITICVQSLGQLQNRYPNNLWAELLGNCDIQIMLGCTDDITAEYISERSGEMSIQVDSTRRSRKVFAPFEVVPDYQQTEGKGQRILLTKDEVLRLPPQEELLILRGYNILKLNKWDYTNHPMSKEMREISIYDYYADGVDYDSVEEKEKAIAEARAQQPENTDGSDSDTGDGQPVSEFASSASAYSSVFHSQCSSKPQDDSLDYIFSTIRDVNNVGPEPTGRVCADDDGFVNIPGRPPQYTKPETVPDEDTPDSSDDDTPEVDEDGYYIDKETGELKNIHDEDGTAPEEVSVDDTSEDDSSDGDEPPKNSPPKNKHTNSPGSSPNNPVTISDGGTTLRGF